MFIKDGNQKQLRCPSVDEWVVDYIFIQRNIIQLLRTLKFVGKFLLKNDPE